MFYAAVHSIEAYFGQGDQPAHSINHADRKQRIRKDPVLSPIANFYRDLENFSMLARYHFCNLTTDQLNEAWRNLRRVLNSCGEDEMSFLIQTNPDGEDSFRAIPHGEGGGTPRPNKHGDALAD
jgi:hypothetical protein